MKIGPKRDIGRPADDWRRADMMRRMGIRYFNPKHQIPDSELEQLCRCKDDCARRLLLGISEPFTDGERPWFPPRKPMQRDHAERMMRLSERIG